jgi:hypothetical protein
MRPFTVLIGIVLGSAASITFGLGAVLIVFCVLAREHPDLSHELPQLVASLIARGVSWGRSRHVRGEAGRTSPPPPAYAR